MRYTQSEKMEIIRMVEESSQVWNTIPEWEKERVVEVARQYDLPPQYRSRSYVRISYK